jgi:hypothetical protein
MRTPGVTRELVQVRRLTISQCVRRLGPLLGGLVLQTTPTGCDPPLSALPNTFWQDIVAGIGSALSSLAEALILTLIA